ncbi:UNVERIFIED_CONTAM: Protein wwc3 [Gekko kuhli]
MDHINQLTQIEDPREQWRREQERMLKEYLIVAQEALNAKKEIYQIKQQRFELAQEEYQQLHKMCEDDSRSYTSSYVIASLALLNCRDSVIPALIYDMDMMNKSYSC